MNPQRTSKVVKKQTLKPKKEYSNFMLEKELHNKLETPNTTKTNLMADQGIEYGHKTSGKNTETIRNAPDVATSSDLLAIRSVFYDADWNPQGTAPSQHKNVSYNPLTFVRRGNPIKPLLANLENIKVPKDSGSTKQ